MPAQRDAEAAVRDFLLPPITLDQHVLFLEQHLRGENLKNALRELHEVVPIPHQFPGGGDPGGSNNYDQAHRAVIRARMLKGYPTERINAEELAIGWMRAYKRQGYKRDGGHRFLDGLLALFFHAVDIGEGDLAKETLDTLILHGHGFARENLKRYEKADWGGIRYVTREIANISIAGWALRHIRGDEKGASECYRQVDSAWQWFLGREFTRPLDTSSEIVTGWGRDADGTLFVADMIDGEKNRWNRCGSGVHIPYQTFSTMWLALWSAAKVYRDSEGPHLTQALRALFDLETSFRHFAYVDHTSPMYRGTGHTDEHPLWKDARGGKPIRLARPMELGIPTGSMLYPYWHFASGEDVPRMLEAHVVQTCAHWPDQLGLTLYDPGLLRVAIEWLEQRDPSEERTRRDRLQEAHRLLTREGLEPEAGLLRAITEGVESYLKATRKDG